MQTIPPVLLPHLDALADLVLAKRDQKRPRADYGVKHRRCIALLALNLYALACLDPRACTSVPCAKPWYSAAGRSRRNLDLSYRSLVGVALAGLVRLGFAAVVRRGSPVAGHATLVRGTALLMSFLERAGPPPIGELKLADY